jgi:DNA polymerase-1
VYIDQEYLKTIGAQVTKDLARLGREITKLIGHPINLNSTAQLQDYFFGSKGYKPMKLTKGGKTGVRKPAVDADVLDHLAKELKDPVAELLLQYRELEKLNNTYIQGIQESLDRWGRVHTRFNQDVARTGRLSSANINLQNIPRPDTDKYKIRRAFIAEPGNDLIVADYEQLEMRLLACAAMEKDMIDIFLKGWDIHMGNAALVFGIPYEDIEKAKKTDQQVKEGKLPESAMTDYFRTCLIRRQQVKSVGFGLNYGMKERKLANALNIPIEEAKGIIERYMSRYPAVERFYAESIETAKRTGYAFTLLGRRRFLPEINSVQNDARWRAERQASNVPIQGTAADVVKMAMILCDKANLTDEYGYHMLIQVHDELMFEGPKETAQPCKKVIKEIMEDSLPSKLAVPLTVSIANGANWMECH